MAKSVDNYKSLALWVNSPTFCLLATLSCFTHSSSHCYMKATCFARCCVLISISPRSAVVFSFFLFELAACLHSPRSIQCLGRWWLFVLFFSRGHTMLLGQWSEIKLTNSSAPTGECCWLLQWKKKQFEVSAGWSSRNGSASNCRNWNARLCVITFQALERSYLCSRLKLHREEEKKESECLSHCHLITSSNTLIYVLIGHLIEFFTLNEECSSSLSSAVRDNHDNDRRREEVKKSVEIGNCR